MIKQDADVLVSQLRHIMLNREVNKEQKCESEEMQELQEAVFYLADCMSEFQMFLQEVCAGNLEAVTPPRQNFLSGRVKEIHSVLKHLTWQTSKVAGGDYKQKVHFLGEFSVSFNKMVKQLEEREISLKEKSEALSRSEELLISVMDKQEDWIFVVDKSTAKIVFANKTAKIKFIGSEAGQEVSEKYEEFFWELVDSMGAGDYDDLHHLKELEMILSVKGYPLIWDAQEACAFFISDVTEEIIEKRELENKVYEDALTSVHNRRFCLEKMEALLMKNISFSLAIIDMDKLKYVNDTFGHTVGDEYILLVSRHIADIIRISDAVCRIGGDEFVVILPECEEAAAEAKMCEVLDNLIHLKMPYPTSISYGVVYVEKETKMGAETILTLADEKMYQMKQCHHEHMKKRK